MRLLPRGAAGAAFPLGVMLLLALLTVWLERTIELATPEVRRSAIDAPDFIVERFTLTRLGEDGARRYSVAAARMTHVPDNDTSLLVDLRVTQPLPGRADMSVRADRGVMVAGGEVMHLHDNVNLFRPGTPAGAGSPASADLRMHTSYLRVLPDADRAETPEPVRIEEGASILNGRGMNFDNRYRRFALDAEVRAVYRRNSSGASP